MRQLPPLMYLLMPLRRAQPGPLTPLAQGQVGVAERFVAFKAALFPRGNVRAAFNRAGFLHVCRLCTRS